MRKQFRLLPIAMAMVACMLVATPVGAQEKPSEASGAAEDAADIVGDVSIIAESTELVGEATELADGIDKVKKTDNVDRSKHIGEIRTIRFKIIKKTPVLRTLLDNLRKRKDTLYVTTFDSLPTFVDPPSDARPPSNIDEQQSSIQFDIDRLKIDIDEKKKTAPGSTDVAKMELQLAFLQQRLQSAKDAKKQGEAREAERVKLVEQQKADRAALFAERNRQSKVIDATISKGDIAARNLDDALNRLDDLTGSLLQADADSAAYTDRATIVFAVLVGGVIIGFFVVAFTSEAVKTAIFAGDSGIQFVTMFSLVIAIILFGVLKILEGRELAALLGGLSGYILGRGSQKDQAGRDNTPTTQPATPPPPTPPTTSVAEIPPDISPVAAAPAAVDTPPAVAAAQTPPIAEPATAAAEAQLADDVATAAEKKPQD